MPVISRFYGITVSMYYNEHQPPHIHVHYGDNEELLEITTGYILQGKLPKRAHKMLMEWWGEHRDEPLEMWENDDRGKKIRPLD